MGLDLYRALYLVPLVLTICPVLPAFRTLCQMTGCGGERITAITYIIVLIVPVLAYAQLKHSLSRPAEMRYRFQKSKLPVFMLQTD